MNNGPARRRRRGRTSSQGPGANDQGAAAVEFALILPILALLVFGILQFGFAFAQVLALNSAARQGARVGVTGGATCSEVDAATVSAASSIGGTADVTVAKVTDPDGSPDACVVKPCKDNRGKAFRVTVSKPFGITLPLPFISSSVTLTGKGEYRCESND